MDRSADQSDPPVLEYVSTSDRSEHRGVWTSAASFMCMLMPITALVLHSAPLLLLGTTLFAWLGCLLGAAACLQSRRHGPDLGVAMTALAINASLAAFGYWLICVRGIS